MHYFFWAELSKDLPKILVTPKQAANNRTDSMFEEWECNKVYHIYTRKRAGMHVRLQKGL